MALLKKILGILQVVVIVALFAITIVVLSGTNGDEIAQDPFFNSSLLPVLSDSMKHEDGVEYEYSESFKSGDLIVAIAIDEDYELEVGDIISFWDIIGGYKVINTHRIVAIDDDGTIWQQGDNREMSTAAEVVNRTDIVAIYKTSIPLVGSIVLLLQDTTVFFIVIILPLLIMFLFNIKNLFDIVNKSKKEKKIADATKSGVLTEDMKQQAIADYLKKLEEQGSVDTDDTNN